MHNPRDPRNPSTEEVTQAVMLHGPAQHDAYRGGWVALLRRALR